MSLINIKKTMSAMALVALTGAQCHAALTPDGNELLAANENPAIVAARPTTIHEQFTQAAKQGDTELVRQLLESQANIKSTDTAFATALNLAVQYKHSDTIKFLLSHREGYQLRSLQALAARAVNDKLQQRAAIVDEQIITKARFDHANVSQKGLTFCFMQRFIAHADENPFSALTAVITYPSPDDLKNYPTESIEQVKQHSQDIVHQIITEYKDQFDTQAYTKALEMAVLSGKAQIVSLLLNTQACITDKALEYTINRGHTEIVTMLLNSIKTRSLEAHHAADETIDENTLKAEVAARINSANTKFDSLLVKAVRKHHTEMVHILLDAGININKIVHGNHTALTYATSLRSDDKITSLLLNAGADIFSISTQGRSALSNAANDGNIEKVKQLLSILTTRTENPNDLRLRYRTALYEAIKNNHIEVIHTLLQAIKDNPQINHIIEHAFKCTFECGSTQTAHLFLDAAIERSSYRSWGLASTSSTVSREHAAAVGQLCQNAGLDIAGDAGAAALLSASTAGCIETVCLLLDAGAQASNAIAPDGNTALTGLVEAEMTTSNKLTPNRYIRLIQILLHAGAATPEYINARGAMGQTALEMAIQKAKYIISIVNMLKQLDQKKEEGRIKVANLESKKQLLIINELLRAGAIIDDQSKADIEQWKPEFHKYIGS